jgi:glycosyltransferase involved in cell wall biosynthesis
MSHAFLFISSLGAGGAERAMSELAGGLIEAGWRVTLATMTSPDAVDRYPLKDGVRRVHLGNPPPAGGLLGKLRANAVRIRRLRAAMRAFAPAVVVSFMESNNVLALLAARPLGLPVVVAERTDPSLHLPHVPAMWRWGRRRFYRRAAAVVAQTREAADWLQVECNCPATVLPNALRALPAPTAAREDWIVSAGRLEPVKGYDIVLAAFARVAPELDGWRLVIAGEGRLRKDLQDRAAALGITGRVDWLGHRDDVERVLERASVVALASRYEGFPNVLLESLGMGAAVVATECRSGPSEMIDHDVNGLLVPVDDVEAMAAGMRRLATDPSLRERFGVHARSVRDTYAAPIIMQRWVALLTSAAALRP